MRSRIDCLRAPFLCPINRAEGLVRHLDPRAVVKALRASPLDGRNEFAEFAGQIQHGNSPTATPDLCTHHEVASSH